MGTKIQIDQMADAVNEQLENYARLTTETVKTAVTKAGNAVKKDIAATAPERTGKYAKSWRTKKTKESSTELEITVYSPTRYMLAHLLEHGHAKRGGGRVRAIQGLELDYSIVAWDADFRFNGTEWTYYNFVGNRWQNVSSEERRLYLKNAYRVLLTRARQGMIIFIPAGSDTDETRKREWYDAIFNYLCNLGIETI